jgi:hypothetical protein
MTNSQQFIGNTDSASVSDAGVSRFTELDIAQLVIEDDTGVDNFQSEQQQRLLVEPLYSSLILQPPLIPPRFLNLELLVLV